MKWNTYRIISFILVFSLVLGTLNLTEIGKIMRVETQEVKGDGKVNLKDVTRLKQYLLGWKVSIH